MLASDSTNLYSFDIIALILKTGAARFSSSILLTYPPANPPIL
jgi:hypothetical protein